MKSVVFISMIFCTIFLRPAVQVEKINANILKTTFTIVNLYSLNKAQV